jgi:hypothetical protein
VPYTPIQTQSCIPLGQASGNQNSVTAGQHVEIFGRFGYVFYLRHVAKNRSMSHVSVVTFDTVCLILFVSCVLSFRLSLLINLFIVFHVCTSFCRIAYACFSFLRSFNFLMAIFFVLLTFLFTLFVFWADTVCLILFVSCVLSFRLSLRLFYVFLLFLISTSRHNTTNFLSLTQQQQQPPPLPPSPSPLNIFHSSIVQSAVTN